MPQKQKFPHLVGSKWTARQTIDGWRHFQVVNRKNEGKWVFAELVASCDPSVRFWLNAKMLNNRTTWEAGWKSLGERLTAPEIVPVGVGKTPSEAAEPSPPS
jgi:tryptophan-rich hypothetical protein